MDFSGLRPAGGKRSSKREFIVDAFLRQEGHLSADDLVDLIRKEDRGIFVLLSAATPTRLLAAFPPGTPIRRLSLAEAAERVRSRLSSAPAFGHHALDERQAEDAE